MEAEADPLHAALTRYRAAFGEPPPIWGWSGPDTALIELIDAAIRAGRRLDESSLARAMGVRPAPLSALI